MPNQNLNPSVQHRYDSWNDELHNWLPWFPSCLSMRIYRRKTSEKIHDFNPTQPAKRRKTVFCVQTKTAGDVQRPMLSSNHQWFMIWRHLFGRLKGRPSGSSFVVVYFVASSSPKKSKSTRGEITDHYRSEAGWAKFYILKTGWDAVLLVRSKYGCTWNLKHPRIEMVVLIR